MIQLKMNVTIRIEKFKEKIKNEIKIIKYEYKTFKEKIKNEIKDIKIPNEKTEETFNFLKNYIPIDSK